MIYERVNGISEMEMQNQKSYYELKKQIKNRKRKSQLEFREVLDKEMKKDEW